jgi:hypothetical protein
VEHLKEKCAGSTGPRKKFLVGLVVAISVLSCAAAWRDIARRGDDEVRGPKLLWRIVFTMNPGNSLLYWLFGRR